MRAAFYQGARTFTTGTVATPTPAPGQALLRVKRVGICGTDLHIFQGHLDHRVPKGGIIGHEIFGEVTEAPAGSGFNPGDRVVVEPLSFCQQRSEEHTSELQSPCNLVCRLLLEKKKKHTLPQSGGVIAGRIPLHLELSSRPQLSIQTIQFNVALHRSVYGGGSYLLLLLS